MEAQDSVETVGRRLSRDSLIYTKDRLTEAFPGESGRDPHREV